MNKPIQTQDGLEFPVQWTCPNCQHVQTDTVHPTLGPFFSATCGACVAVFGDEQLSPQDFTAWDEARNAAEALALVNTPDAETGAEIANRP